MSDLISRQAAIDEIHKAVLEMFDFCDDIIEEPMTYTEEKMLEANKLIADKIRNLPSAQPEQSASVQEILDYINAELHPIVSPEHWDVYANLHDMISSLSLLEQAKKDCRNCKHGRYIDDHNTMFCYNADDCTDWNLWEPADLPSAQPWKKGKWIHKPGIYGAVYCSECDFELRINDTPYCPNCGAEMMKGEEECH